MLDNLETVLEPGASVARYRAGYEGYGEVLRQLGESTHQGCLLVTGRERRLSCHFWRGRPVRTLRLGGLVSAAGRALLQERGLAGDEAAWEGLVARYGGNPLALRVVGETIDVVFGGDIAAFLAQDAPVFGGIRQLLDEQVERLSSLEGAVLHLAGGGAGAGGLCRAGSRPGAGGRAERGDGGGGGAGSALAAGAGHTGHLHPAAGGAGVCHHAAGHGPGGGNRGG